MALPRQPAQPEQPQPQQQPQQQEQPQPQEQPQQQPAGPASMPTYRFVIEEYDSIRKIVDLLARAKVIKSEYPCDRES